MSKQYTDNETAPLALHAVAQPLVQSLWEEAKEWRDRAEVAEKKLATISEELKS